MQDKNGDAASPAPVITTAVPPLATSTALPAGDALRADIAALQQQALAAQASIRELQQREAQLSSTLLPEMPQLPPLEVHYSADTLFLLPALALAALLLWIRTRRASPAGASAATPASFVEKRAPRPEDDPHWVDRDLDFVESDHHSDWGQEAKALAEDDTGADSRFWEPDSPAKPAAFDSETAAVEVHKVRASLAHKRAARSFSLGSHSGHAPLYEDNVDPTEDAEENIEPTVANPRKLRPVDWYPTSLAGRATVDLELDITLDAQHAPEAGPEVPAVSETDGILSLDLDLGLDLGLDSLPAEAHPDPQPEPEPDVQAELETEPPSFSLPDAASELPITDTDDETACEIKLALAQEFMELGLLPGAREIASELLDSQQADVRERASLLLRSIQEKEGVDDMPLFESSAFVDPTTLSVSTAAQLLATDATDPGDSDGTVHWRD